MIILLLMSHLINKVDGSPPQIIITLRYVLPYISFKKEYILYNLLLKILFRTYDMNKIMPLYEVSLNIRYIFYAIYIT